MRNNLEALEAHRLLSAGDLDPTFGTGGKAITPFPQNLLISDSAVLADDKIVLAGDAPGADGIQVYFFRRLNADGSVDTSFGNQGDATGSFQAGKDALLFSALIQPDGTVLALGDSGGTANLAQFDPNGTLDTTFNGTGFVDLSDIGGALGVQSDGKILVTGRNGLTRFNADGSIDTAFGVAGTTSSYVKQGTADNISSSLNVGVIKEQPDGKLLLGGGIQEHHNDRFAMARLNTDGSLDTTFGSGGLVKTPTTSVPPIVDGIQDLAVLGNGQILAAGTGRPNDRVGSLQRRRHGRSDFCQSGRLHSVWNVGRNVEAGDGWSGQCGVDRRGDRRRHCGGARDAQWHDRRVDGRRHRRR